MPRRYEYGLVAAMMATDPAAKTSGSPPPYRFTRFGRAPTFSPQSRTTEGPPICHIEEGVGMEAP